VRFLKLFFSLALIAVLLCTGVQGATVTNSIYKNDFMSVGSSATFDSTFTPDNANEIGIPLTVSRDGDCGLWLSPDKKVFNLTTTGTTIRTTIRIPSNAKMGSYECRVVYSSPISGMTRASIAVPYYLNVTNGTNGYREVEPVPTATPVPEAPSEKLTAQETHAKAISTAMTSATTRTTEQAPNSEGKPDSIAGTTIAAGIAGLLIAAFAIVGIWDYRRGKR
jgi:hypothetical protein